ncbi:MAG TPA: uracil-DNA glycosylase [bacterium]|nr:uracil-DNA glycosylase [bacterium]
MNVWEELREKVVTCNKCALAEGRTNAVFGEGDVNTQVVFIGEGPGQEEDRQGRPFVGAAGKLLDKMIEEIGLKRSDVFIGNIVKCRPPGNRDPKPEEIDACKDYLFAQIAFINPKVICTLGRHSLHTLVHPDISISKEHGRAVNKMGKVFLPMYHPAAALYRRELLDKLRYDFEQLKRLLERGV